MPRWEESGVVRLVLRPQNLARHSSETARILDKAAPPTEGARITFVGKIEPHPSFGSGNDLRSKKQFKSIKSFENGIEAILVQCQADWKTSVLLLVRAWTHSEINEQSVNEWLKQFEKFGNNFMGERLLKDIDFWSAGRVRESITPIDRSAASFDVVCVKRTPPGKSGDIISSILRKHLNASEDTKLQIADFYSVLREEFKFPRNILFVEDCLLTGTEMINMFSGMLDLPSPPNHPWKVDKLSDPRAINDHSIELRFATATTLGVYRLSTFLETNGLKNISIKIQDKNIKQVLTKDGELALVEGRFFDAASSKYPASPELFLNRELFNSPWYRDDQSRRTLEFCASIGRQLFQNYLHAKSWEWDSERIDCCSMGMCGLALSLAFHHSIPKSTLPLYWAEGPIVHDRKNHTWKPLFENGSL